MDEALDKELQRVIWEFREENVDVLVLQNLGPIDIDKFHLNLVQGQKNQLPLWIAETLEEEQIVQIKGFEEVNLSFILKLAYDETNSKRLSALNTSMFIEKIKDVIKRLENSSNINTVRKLTSVRGSFNTIMRQRFKKILNYTQGTNVAIKNKRYLSKEEEWLYNKLRELFETWGKLTEIKLDR